MRLLPKGFTTVEILVAMAILAIMVLPVAFSVQQAQVNYAMRTTADEITNLLNTARAYATTDKEERLWGVRPFTLSGKEVYQFGYFVPPVSDPANFTAVKTYELQYKIRFFNNSPYIIFARGSGALDSTYNIPIDAPTGTWNSSTHRFSFRIRRPPTTNRWFEVEVLPSGAIQTLTN